MPLNLADKNKIYIIQRIVIKDIKIGLAKEYVKRIIVA